MRDYRVLPRVGVAADEESPNRGLRGRPPGSEVDP